MSEARSGASAAPSGAGAAPSRGRRAAPILLVSYSGGLGGAERLLLDYAAAVAGPATLACPPGELAAAARGRDIDVVEVRARSPHLRASARDRAAAPVRLAAMAREVRRVVADIAPAVVVGWSMRGLLCASAALTGRRRRPRLVFHHNDFLPSRGVARLVRAAAARADRTIALSHAVAADLDPRGALAVEVVLPGVDLERFAPRPLPTGPPTALVLGAIVDWKRPDLALEAVAAAARDLPELRCVVAGAPLDAGGERLLENLERRSRAADLAGRVELTGPRDAADALAGATCLLHCADREPFGLVVAEALACGRPVAAPRSGGPFEIVDRSCGTLYAPGDPVAAAAAIVDVVRRSGDLSAPARARAEAKFDGRASARRFAAVVEEVTTR